MTTETSKTPGRRGGSNKVLSMREAAEYIGCSYDWLAHHYRDGHGIPFVKYDGRVRFLQRHLDAFLEAHTETS